MTILTIWDHPFALVVFILVPVLFHIILDALQGHYIANTRRAFLSTEVTERD
jgi:hypothetical protein